MQFLASRQKSFFQGSVWPHPIQGWKATPETLSNSGFYFNPVPGSADNVTCHLCNKSLDGWELQDDPMQEHSNHSPDCPLVIISKSSTSSTLVVPVPRKKLEQARLDTFGSWWPHETIKNLSSKQMVKAGFVFCGTQDSPDAAECLLCKLTLDGWEEDDDPIIEHSRRSEKCPFFSKKRVKATTTVTATDSSPRKISRTRSSSRSTAAYSADTSIAFSTRSSIANSSMSSQAHGEGTLRKTRSRKAKKEDEDTDASNISMISTASSRTSKRGRKKKKISEEQVLDPEILSASLESVALMISDKAPMSKPFKDEFLERDNLGTEVIDSNALGESALDNVVSQINLKEKSLENFVDDDKTESLENVTATNSTENNTNVVSTVMTNVKEEEQIPRAKRGRKKEPTIRKKEPVPKKTTTRSTRATKKNEKEPIEPVVRTKKIISKKAKEPEQEHSDEVKENNENIESIVATSMKQETSETLEKVSTVKSEVADNNNDLFSEWHISEEDLELTVEEYLKKLHEKELCRLIDEAEEKVQEFIRYYNEQLDTFKKSVQIID